MDEIRAQVIIGNDAEEFVQSELGKVCLGMAEQDFLNAAHAFCEVDLSDGAKVMKLQQDMKVARQLNQYLVELIHRGREVLAAQT